MPLSKIQTQILSYNNQLSQILKNKSVQYHKPKLKKNNLRQLSTERGFNISDSTANELGRPFYYTTCIANNWLSNRIWMVLNNTNLLVLPEFQ